MLLSSTGTMKSGLGVPLSWKVSVYSCILLGIYSQLALAQEPYLDDEISIGGSDVDYYTEPTIVIDPDHNQVAPGGSIYGRCSVVSGGQYSFKWIRRLRDGSTQILSENANLYIGAVQMDALNDRFYCVATRLSDNRTFEKMLNVAPVESDTTFTEVIQPTRSEMSLVIRALPGERLEQGSIMRQCMFEDNPDANADYDFRWIDHNGRVVTSGDTLYVMVSDASELGNFTCEATHQQSRTTYQAKYRVNREAVTAATHYVVNIRKDTAEPDLGRGYEMTCEVTPNPSEPVTFRWYYKDQLVSSGATLYLRPIRIEDLGTYVCQAEWTPYNTRTSIHTNATSTISLQLTRDTKIEMIAPPGSVMVSMPGETRELHCEYDVSSPNNVIWLFNGVPLERHNSVNASGKVIRINRMRVSIITLRGVETTHAGLYECNVDGRVKMTTFIVRDEYLLEVNPKSEEVDEGGDAEFHCRAQGYTGNINRQLEWYFRPFSSSSMVPLDVSSPDGFKRSDSPFTEHTSFISNNNVRKAHEGEYICRLPSAGKQVQGRLTVRVSNRYTVYITPSILKVRANQPIELECYVTDESGRSAPVSPMFRTPDQRLRFDTVPLAENRMRFRLTQGLTAAENGTRVECYSDGSPNVASSIIVVEDFCPPGYRRCRTGQCLPAGRFCDGHPDCADRSDEDPQLCRICDPIAKKCEYVGGRPSTKSTYMIHWQCDGEDDCGNGFDEQDCQALYRDVATCQQNEFTCEDGKRIPSAFLCDKDRDCRNGEDESSCGPPVISTARTNRYPVRQGEQVILQCEVTGHPLPRVIWRFNWGCIPENDPRFQVTSTARNCNTPTPTVISTLTISNVQPGHDGIYNCEGLSGPNRALSNDYFVMLHN